MNALTFAAAVLSCCSCLAATDAAFCWTPVDSAPQVSLLPSVTAVAACEEADGCRVVAVRSPEAHVVLGIGASARKGASGGVAYALSVPRALPKNALVRLDVENASCETAAFEVAFRFKDGGGFGYDVRLPPGRKTLDLSPDCRHLLGGLAKLPDDPWRSVAGVAFSAAARQFGGGGVPAQRLVVRNMTAVEAVRMRNVGGVPRPEEREILSENGKRPFVCKVEAGAFLPPHPDARGHSLKTTCGRQFAQIPDFGRGGAVIVKVRATDADTRRLEITLQQNDGAVWGTELPLGTDWRELRVPLDQLHYFSHWRHVPRQKEGDKPDVRRLACVGLCFGKWLCKDTLDRPHGFEIESIRITQ